MIPKRRLLTLMFACLCFKKSFFINILNELRKKTWACDHFKTFNLSADKNTRPSMGRHLSPRYGQVILVSRYLAFTAINWSQHWCAIGVQYQFSYAPKRARKCEIKHWLPCGVDGRAVYGHVITKFSGMGRFTYPWCSAGALRARSSAAITVIEGVSEAPPSTPPPSQKCIFKIKHLYETPVF